MVQLHVTPEEILAKIKRFFIKYFFEGQKLNSEQSKAIESISPDTPWTEKILIKYRRFIGLVLPFLFFETCWWCLAIKHNFFQYFPDRYLLSITMIFGSMIGGMTSEGSGAVAFPVMTLVLGIPNAVARDFSLMIQSVGMTAASCTILFMKIQLEWHSIIFCSLGGLFGIIFGLEVVDPLLSAAATKLIFVSVWFSFSFALYLLNRQHKRKTYDSIPNFTIWHAIILVGTGFIGGIFSAISGSGLDICSFSVLSLLFRVSEKVSTPTSVILMAGNTMTGFFWRELMTFTGAEREAWKYWAVCVPISAAAGPIGSFLSSHFHRQVLAAFVYVLDTMALITALIVIPIDLHYGLLVAGLLVSCFALFLIMCKIGERIVNRIESSRNADSEPELESEAPPPCSLATSATPSSSTSSTNHPPYHISIP